MTLDLARLRAELAAHGPLVRVVIAGHAGSSPRETGAAMHVWASGQSGTIGGGALEFAAAETAREMVRAVARDSPRAAGRGAAHGGMARLARHALGPALGQCCGGAVTLIHEAVDAGWIAAREAGTLARPVAADAAAQMPLRLHRALARARSGRGETPHLLCDGWWLEPLAQPRHPVWIWGAGHVGRALAGVLAPLPDLALTWIDCAESRFPQAPAGPRRLIAAHPATLVAQAPPDARHLVLTYSHALDLDLCHRLLGHGFAGLGLIGSATKWARFRGRLAALGHPPDQIARITCPIGAPALGKHPQAIALGVAVDLVAALRDEAVAGGAQAGKIQRRIGSSGS